ncbi:MbtH family NRPS accessory protein [Streptomyces cadmiisoli]
MWPAFVEGPAGWEIVFNEAPRQDCLDHIERSMTDMRPKSLVDAMAGNGV